MPNVQQCLIFRFVRCLFWYAYSVALVDLLGFEPRCCNGNNDFNYARPKGSDGAPESLPYPCKTKGATQPESDCAASTTDLVAVGTYCNVMVVKNVFTLFRSSLFNPSTGASATNI